MEKRKLSIIDPVRDRFSPKTGRVSFKNSISNGVDKKRFFLLEYYVEKKEVKMFFENTKNYEASPFSLKLRRTSIFG